MGRKPGTHFHHSSAYFVPAYPTHVCRYSLPIDPESSFLHVAKATACAINAVVDNLGAGTPSIKSKSQIVGVGKTTRTHETTPASLRPFLSPSSEPLAVFLLGRRRPPHLQPRRPRPATHLTLRPSSQRLQPPSGVARRRINNEDRSEIAVRW